MRTALTNDPAAFNEARDIAARHAHTSPALMSFAQRRAPSARRPGPGAVRLAQARRSSPLVCAALTRLRDRRDQPVSPSQPARRGLWVPAITGRSSAPQGEPAFRAGPGASRDGPLSDISRSAEAFPAAASPSGRYVKSGCHSLRQPAGWPWSRRRGDGVVKLELPADARVQISFQQATRLLSASRLR